MRLKFAGFKMMPVFYKIKPFNGELKGFNTTPIKELLCVLIFIIKQSVWLIQRRNRAHYC